MHLAPLGLNSDDQAKFAAAQFVREQRERTITEALVDEMRKHVAARLEKPKRYLVTWREILDALDLESNKERRDLVRKLSKDFDGPIILPLKGGQPKVEQTKLLKWWNSLIERFEQIAQNARQRADDRQASTGATHNYGRGATVIPDMKGSVKRRRKDRKR